MSKVLEAIVGATGREIISLPVSELVMTFDVRKELNEDRVQSFMDMYQAGKKLPPIEVVRGTVEIHDGRHRKAALERVNAKYADCVLIEPMDFVDRLVDAFGKNLSESPLPPTRADVMFVMRQLLEGGVSNAQVQKRFREFYALSHVRKLLSDVQSVIVKANMTRAKQAVAHGNMTVDAAAKKHGVDAEKLQEEITGVKKRRRQPSVGDVKSEITTRYRTNSHKTAFVFRDLFQKFEDGEIDGESVLDVVLHAQRLNQDAAKRLNGWIERFESLKSSLKA